MQHDPAPISGHDLFKVLYGSTFKLNRSEIAGEVNALVDKIEAEYASGKMLEKKPRILITGCPIGGATEKVIRAVEDNGGVVVTYENCTGAKSIDRLVDENAEDIYQAIAERYLAIGCSVMTPNPNRFDLMGRLIDEYQVDGVLEMTLQACHTYNIEAKSIEKRVKEKGLPYYVIGKGSNMLFSDDGFDGVIIEIGKGLEKIEISDDGVVTAQAGVSLAYMASRLASKGLKGFAFAGGIPGTLGGGVAMNAGAYGGEIKDCIVSAKVLTKEGERVVLKKEDLQLSYRNSVILQKGYLVLEATFSFEKGNPAEIQEEIKELNKRRREKQPLEYPSAGSTFKRPEGYFAGKLIEDAGLRGYRVGDAQVSEKHCGFVVNRGEATAKDVAQLISDVQNRVMDEFGVKLEPEVRMIGFE